MSDKKTRPRPSVAEVLSLCLVVSVLVAGCGMAGMWMNLVGASGFGLPDGLAGQVAAKAMAVGDRIGGAGGFGGALMDGHRSHMMNHMGFHGVDDLADPDGNVLVRLYNESGEACTFHLTYFASHMGLDDQTMDVVVPAGEETTVELPCAEILGLGPLDMPGGFGCHLAGGEPVENIMAVPAFLGMDYACGGAYQFDLVPDEDDLDADGDTGELILRSDAMLEHMQFGGRFGLMPGGCGGMMGGHMGGGI